MTEKDDKNLFEIKIDIIDINEISKIKFIYNQKEYEYETLENIMGDIFNHFSSANNINEKRVEFQFNGNTIKKDQTLEELTKQKPVMTNIDDPNQTNSNIRVEKTKKKEPIITINIIEIPCYSYLFKEYKLIFLIILLAIFLIACAVILIVLLLKKNDSKNIKPSSSITIPTEYFIYAEYSSQENETVKLISDEYNINKIKSMSIDGNIIKPTKKFTFNENGLHNVYYSFNEINNETYFSYYNSSLSEGRFIFNGVINLIKVEISNSENKPDVSFYGMFNNCINLQEADFSQMTLYFDYYTDYFYNYYSSMDYMFNNCTKLISLNFDFKKVNYENKINIPSSRYMFNNCTSLKELILNRLSFNNAFNNMFSNCTSLKTIFFSSFKSMDDKLDMSYMFYDCNSLTSLHFPSEQVYLPNNMSYSFAYCTSLRKLDLVFINYYYEPKANMSNAFRNCTSLTSINLQFDLYFEDMSYVFMGCYSLESLEIKYYNDIPFAKYMNGMFLDCNSLEYAKIFEDGFYSNNLTDISYMFAGTLIYAVNLYKLETNNITNYEGLFYYCPYLRHIDISSFTHNNLTGSKLSIFKGEYYYDPNIFISKDFLSRIKVPTNFNIIIIDQTYEHNGTDIISPPITEEVPIRIPEHY